MSRRDHPGREEQQRHQAPGHRACGYMGRALNLLRAQDYPVRGEDAARLPPFVREYIGLDGNYSSHLPDSHLPDLGGDHRPPRDLGD